MEVAATGDVNSWADAIPGPVCGLTHASYDGGDASGTGITPADPASITRINLSSKTYIDTLLSSYSWSSNGTTTALTYGFPTSGSNWSMYGTGSEPYNSFQALSATQAATCTEVLGLWANVANLTFTQVTEPQTVADIRFAITGASSTAWAYYPSTSQLGGDVWFGTGYFANTPTWASGTYYYQTAIHELAMRWD